MRSQSIATRTLVTESPRRGRASFPAFRFRRFAFARLVTIPPILLVLAHQVAAQNVTIQQPAISSFEVGTSVSVPDRGRAFLGGVGSGATSRSTYGPFPMNTNTGRSFRGSSASVHAWIHDFDDLDRQALGVPATGRLRTRDSASNSHAAHAWRTLHESRPRENATSGDAETRQPASAAGISRIADSPERGSLSAAELYDRGMKAHAAGKRGVALVFLRLARDRGSADAARELAAIETAARTAGKHTGRAVNAATGSTDQAIREHGGAP